MSDANGEEIHKDISVKNRDRRVIYAVTTIIILLELLGMFAYFASSTSAEPLFKRKNQSLTVQVNDLSKSNELVMIKENIKVKEPAELSQLLGQYLTEFDSSQTNRVANIQLACQFVNNFKLQPNQVFSYNNVVGERTVERGFKEAPVIVNKKAVYGIGGGICQVSSTLYNAVLEAGLQIVERHHHSIPVSYVPRGRDATVAYDYLDLKFANNRKEYIIIKVIVDDGTVLTQIYSLK